MTTLPAIDFQIWQACKRSLIWNPQMDGSGGRLRVVFSFWVVVNSEVVRTLFFCGFLFWISVLLRAMKPCLQNKEMKALYMSWKHRISSWECCKRSAYRVWKMVFAAHVKSTHVNAICSGIWQKWFNVALHCSWPAKTRCQIFCRRAGWGSLIIRSQESN